MAPPGLPPSPPRAPPARRPQTAACCFLRRPLLGRPSLQFGKFGRVSQVWIARNPPGFAFITMDDDRDADDAVAGLDGKNGWKVSTGVWQLAVLQGSGGGEKTPACLPACLPACPTLPASPG